MNPRLGRGVRLRPDPRDGTPVLLSPERGLRLSPTAAAILALTDGTRAVDAIVSELAARFGGGASAATGVAGAGPSAVAARIDADVRALLGDLRARGLVEGVDAPAVLRGTGAPGPAPEPLEGHDPGDAADTAPEGAPYTLVAELTHRCALACPYCSNPRDLVGRQDELSTADWLRVVDDAAALGVMQMHLTGGEPLARSDLEAIAARAHERELYVSLVTSGVPLDRERLARLAPSLDHVQLSVQDAEAAASDRIADFPSFEQKLRVAAWVKELGLPLTINVVLHRENIEHVGAIVALAERLGADRLELANVQLVAWALDNRAALLPSGAALERARAVAGDARRRLAGTMAIVFVLPDWHADRPRACMDGWGRRFVIVAPDGAVLPCQAARALPLAFEHVQARGLRAIWTKSDALDAFRGESWMPDPCRSCDRRGIDHGGCRCQAFALTGDLQAVDPACALSPRHSLVRAARDEALRGGERRFVFRGRS